MLSNGVYRTTAGRHKPPHLYVPGMPHLVTFSTWQHAPVLRHPNRKDEFSARLQLLAAEHGVDVPHWVLLDDHYHGIMVPEDGPRMAAMFGRLHWGTAQEWNQEDGAPGRKVWYSLWDRVLWTEGDRYSRINYIHRNPVKHGYVGDPEQWPWSTYRSFVAREDPDLAAKMARFPAPRQLPGD